MATTAIAGLKGRRLPLTAIAAIMVVTGAAGLVNEFILGTINGYLLGNNAAEISLAVGVMVVTIGIGAWVQRFVKNEWLLGAFIGAELILALMGGLAPFILPGLYVFSAANFWLFKLFYSAFMGVLIGAEAPAMARLNERNDPELKNNLAKIWMLDGVGAAIGVAVWYQLSGQVDIYTFCIAVAIANVLVALLLLATFGRDFSWPRKTVYSGLTILTVGAISLGFVYGDNWERATNQALYDDPIIHQEMTKYQQIALTKGQHPSDPSGSDYRLFLNGNLQFSSVDEAIYHEYLVHPAMTAAASRERVLILGGGDGLALREVLKYPDVEEVSLVELDPAMIKLAKNHPVLSELNQGAFDDARVHARASKGVNSSGEQRPVMLETGKTEKSDGYTRPETKQVGTVDIYTVDADQFMSASQQPWDVIILDLPDPNSLALAKLYSKEFYAKVNNALAADGIMVVQSSSPYHAKEAFMCIGRTLQAAGLDAAPFHANVPSFGDWGWWIASKSLSADELKQRLATLRPFEVPTEKVEARHMPQALSFHKGWSDTRNHEVSTLMRPVIFELYVYDSWQSY